MVLKRNVLLSAALATTFMGAPSASAATLIIDSNGQLAGATGVEAMDTLFDVEFVDGTCATLFSGCDDSSDFIFTEGFEAYFAAQALLDQVFIGIYDTSPELTAGCTSDVACSLAFPVPFWGSYDYNVASVVNHSEEAIDSIEANWFEADLDLNNFPSLTYARFTPAAVSAVPEPATWAMMIVGFGAIGATMRRRRPGQQVTVAVNWETRRKHGVYLARPARAPCST